MGVARLLLIINTNPHNLLGCFLAALAELEVLLTLAQLTLGQEPPA
jgi:hypothetical protein